MASPCSMHLDMSLHASVSITLKSVLALDVLMARVVRGAGISCWKRFQCYVSLEYVKSCPLWCFSPYLIKSAVSPSVVHHQPEISSYEWTKFHEFGCLVGSEDVESTREVDSRCWSLCQSGSGGTLPSESVACTASCHDQRQSWYVVLCNCLNVKVTGNLRSLKGSCKVTYQWYRQNQRLAKHNQMHDHPII